VVRIVVASIGRQAQPHVRAMVILAHRWQNRLIVSYPRVLMAYVVLLAVAELAVTFVNPLLVFPVHGGLLILAGLAFVLAVDGDQSKHTNYAAASVALVLTVAPLIRLISLTLPLVSLEPAYRYVAAGVPIALGGFLAARATGLGRHAIGLVWRKNAWQIATIVVSIGLGFVEFAILRQQPIGPFPWTPVGFGSALSVGIFTGFPEELIFRGVMQTATRPILGRWNWIYVSAIFAVLHIGYQSYIDVLFVFAVGLFYGWIFERTRSIIGISIGHGLANVVLFFVAPNLIPPEALPIVGVSGQVAVAVAGTMALGIAGLLWHRGLRGHSMPAITSEPQVERPGWPARGEAPGKATSPLGPIRFTVRAEPGALAADAARGVVPAEEVMVPIISHRSFQATQAEDRESRASGWVRFESRNRSRQVIVPARTAITTRSGVVFRTLDGVVLAPATGRHPTVLDVMVEAQVPGPGGNVAAGAISVVGPELFQLHLAVRNPVATSGGSRVKVHRVAASDYQGARAEAIAQAWDEFGRLVAEEAPDGGGTRHVLLETARVDVAVAEPSAARIVGQVADSVELTLHTVATAMSVGLDGLRQAAVTHVRASVPTGFELVPGSVTGKVTDAAVESGTATYTVEVSAQQVPAVPPASAPVH
jgi:CAAX protease family protein